MITDFQESLGFDLEQHANGKHMNREQLVRFVNLKLMVNGLPYPACAENLEQLPADNLVKSLHQRLKLLDDTLCPADRRIETFLQQHFGDVKLSGPLQLPRRTIILDRHGLAREMSLPQGSDNYSNSLVSSYRVRNGVLHNPRHDRRTTKGTFHIAAGGLPVPRDKVEVPKQVFAELFRRAVSPPDELLELPFTNNNAAKARSFVSLLLRPLVCPAVPDVNDEKTLEIRFFVPGSLVSNLDFVESVFGNAGDPFLPGHDAGLDPRHWTGHTGCVILAPHLSMVTKRAAGLPHYDKATERQRRDEMCWRDENELYNDGSPFKLCCRTQAGVIVTLIADNYFGYCKKEVKTQISYSANLFGNAEEEHAGGAIAFASFNLGDEFAADSRRYNNRTFADVAQDYQNLMTIKPEGYGIDKRFPKVVYIPENAHATVNGQKISWEAEGQQRSIPLLPEHVYITPSGYKLQLQKHAQAPTWHLVGTLAEGVFCHKPCTVSGGGKSEISKSIADYVLYGPIFVADLERDLDKVAEVFARDYSDRWASDGPIQPDYSGNASRPVLDPRRSLGSVIKLLTPSTDYTKSYNEWLASIPSSIYALVFVIKQMHRGGLEADWRKDFTVDIVNGTPGHELKFDNRKLSGSYLRVGLLGEQTWRTYKVRQDFAPAQKVQTEDDISASVVVPMDRVDNLGDFVVPATSCKFVQNCEYRLFQRPDDAIHRGLDKQSESDLAREDNFICNFEPLSREQIKEICDRAVDLSQFTAPMQRLLRDSREKDDAYVVCSATPRMVDGQPSKNPRYLQTRPDLMNPLNKYVAEMGTRLFRAVPADRPVRIPVHSVLVGRRNNPPDYANGIRPLAVYNPIHYQELPELFMDFISALTGKSPSTTGAGSEGALTKGPFNALLPITDLNNALVSFLLTGMQGFSTPAGHIGRDIRVDHDISLLIPEIWCRLSPGERDPAALISEGLLEQVRDFEHKGETIPASRLGYRISARFIRRYVGRVFDNPNKVFDEAILKPETQDPDAFADGVKYIAEAHQRVAKYYFEDGSIDQACPPLRALLHIMSEGQFKGKGINDPAIRQMFTVEQLLESDWYRRRLETKRQRDLALFKRHADYIEHFLDNQENSAEASQLGLNEQLQWTRSQLEMLSDQAYLRTQRGFLGADPMAI